MLIMFHKVKTEVDKSGSNERDLISSNEDNVSFDVAQKDSNDLTTTADNHVKVKGMIQLTSEALTGDKTPKDEIVNMDNKDPSRGEFPVSQQMQIPRIIAKNSKLTKASKTDTNGNEEGVIPVSEKNVPSRSAETDTIGKTSHQGDKSKGQNILRLKPSKELITQNGPIYGSLDNRPPIPTIVEGTLIRSNSQQQARKNAMVDNSENIMKETRSLKTSNLRLIRPKNGTSSYFRRSISVDNAEKVIVDERRRGSHIILNNYHKKYMRKQNNVEQYKNSFFWDHKLLSYLSPRLNHPWSRSTTTKPISTRDNTKGKSFQSCTVWIHLQVQHNVQLYSNGLTSHDNVYNTYNY